MRVAEANFQNYKALADVRLQLRPFTVLVGPNGCGKTTALDAIADLLAMADWRAWGEPAQLNPFEQRFGTESRLGDVASQPGHAATEASGVSLEVASRPGFKPGQKALTWELTEPVRPGEYFVEMKLARGDSDPSLRFAPFWTRPERSPADEADMFSEALLCTIGDPPITYARLALDPARIRRPSPGAKTATHQLADDGAGLATMIGLLASKRHPALAAIEAAVARVVPQVRRLLPEPTEIVSDEVEILNVDGQALKRVRTSRVPGWTLKVELASGAVVPISEISEGTLLAMALLTVVYGPDAPEVVLLDDIDRALHPKAQAELIGCLRKILDENPEMQIIATTHSPYLLDLFEPDEVRVMALDAQGHAVCRNLAEAPDLDRLKQAYQTGEIWASIWEDWALEGATGGA